MTDALTWLGMVMETLQSLEKSFIPSASHRTGLLWDMGAVATGVSLSQWGHVDETDPDLVHKTSGFI
ncbi:hypothetical protein KOW79_000775 [Hemibagrus wyckioides]|uniref:Uncharacterized protein n=1 Tax=Hemibagrus wyckioides TaxID=337641 RepID=A0A9D3STF8_9TELE|nr:hypothetical protein KOW79_000775 [Hemibagrus wyckioides]